MGDRRRVALLPLVALIGLAASAQGCTKRDPVYDEPLLIAGSTTMESYVDPVATAFVKKYGATNVVCDPGGAGAGVVAVKRGAIDVAMVGRGLSIDEDEPRLKNFIVAKDGIAVIVNPANTVGSLSMKQLLQIFSGQVHQWNEVGGAQGPIEVVVRETNERSRKSFGDLVMQGNELMAGVKTADSVAAMIDLVKRDPGAIGYVTLRDVAPDTKPLKIDGVEMTRLTMLSGRYPLSRSFYLAVYNPGSLAERFVQFAITKEGQDVLAAQGLVPVY